MAEFSIVGAGALLCSGKCAYCSATSVQDVDFKGKNIKKDDFGKVIWDWDAIKHVFDTNHIIQGAIKSGETLTLNWWSAEPLDFYKEADEYFTWVQTNYPKLKFQAFISTNGIPLARKKVQDWLYEAHKKWGLKIQLSHDGVGQHVRTRTYDPLYDERTKDFIVKLVKDKILDMINCTLNGINYSPFANKLYFDKWRFDNHIETIPMLIKLNHNNDAEYTGPYKLKGEHLRRYMHEMEMLMQQSALVQSNNSFQMVGVYGGWPHQALETLQNQMNVQKQLWQPYAGYLANQMNRFDYFKQWGGCAQYSLGITKETWCINTKGEYVFCQLCNDPEDNPNQKLERPEHCKDCEFKDYNECFPCPDMVFADECEYKKEYMRLMLRMKQYLHIIHSFSQVMEATVLEKEKATCSCNNRGERRC